MARPKIKKTSWYNDEKSPEVIEAEVADMTEKYSDLIESDVQYSLLVDPENKYSMPDKQKEFIKFYVDYKNIGMAAEFAGLEYEVAQAYFVAYSSQQEIRRINRALYQRQFRNKLLSVQDIGGFLSSLITDENVPTGDRLKTIEKVKVAQMILDLNDFSHEAFNKPNIIMVQNIETQIKSMSVGAIKNMLEFDSKKQSQDSEKDDLIEAIDVDNALTPEEIAYMKTMSVKDLLELVENISKEE